MNDIETTAARTPRSTCPPTRRDLTERAEAEGLLDVAYASVDSPLGPLVVAATPKGLVRVSYSEFRGEDEVLEELARRVSPRVLEAPARLDPVRRELDEYFEGRREGFDVADRLVLPRRLHARGAARHGAIGFGEVSTYAGVAAEARQPARGPRGRQRARREPDAGGRALPPRAAHRRDARRLHGRAREEGVPAAPGGCAALASTPSGEVAEWLKALAC